MVGGKSLLVHTFWYLCIQFGHLGTGKSYILVFGLMENGIYILVSGRANRFTLDGFMLFALRLNGVVGSLIFSRPFFRRQFDENQVMFVATRITCSLGHIENAICLRDIVKDANDRHSKV